MSVAVEYLYRPDHVMTEEQGWPAPPFRHCLMAMEENRISLRDLRILKELAYSLYLTRNQIHYLCLNSVSRSVVRRRIEVMQRLGLITAIRWEVPREGQTPMRRVAYSLALNGAKLLQFHYGRPFPWRPGNSQRHLKRVLSVLAANEFRLQVMTQQEDAIEGWRIFSHSVGPVARFNLGEQVVLLETPRDDEDVYVINPNRYNRWVEESPLILCIAPNEALASRLFNQLKEELGAGRMVFTTDERAFGTSISSEGYIWQWNEDGQAQALSLV